MPKYQFTSTFEYKQHTGIDPDFKPWLNNFLVANGGKELESIANVLFFRSADNNQSGIKIRPGDYVLIEHNRKLVFVLIEQDFFDNYVTISDTECEHKDNVTEAIQYLIGNGKEVLNWILNTSKIIVPTSTLFLSVSGNDLIIDFNSQANFLIIAEPNDFIFFHGGKINIAKPDSFLLETILIED